MNFLGKLFIVFCLFPYIRILPINIDAQPNALILGTLIIAITKPIKVKKYIFDLLLVLVFAIILMILTSPNINGIRILSNYFSLFIISFATYLVLTDLRRIPYNLFVYIVYIWGIVGLIQLFYPTFLSFLTLRGAYGGPTYGRGVSSLAVEPTFYGMICVFLMMINYINFRNMPKYKFTKLVCIIQLIFFSRSTTCFMALILAFCCYAAYKIVTSRSGLKIVGLSVITLLLGHHLLHIYVGFSDSRFSNVLQAIFSDPSTFLTIDYSVNHRFTHAFLTIKGFFDNFFIPHGFNDFSLYLERLLKDPFWSNTIVIDPKIEERITTSLGGTLFELGLLSTPLFMALFGYLKKLTLSGYNGVLIGLILLSMMMNAMNFNQAILPFFIGNLIYLKYQQPSTSNPTTSSILPSYNKLN